MIDIKKHWHIKEIGKWGLVISIWFSLQEYPQYSLVSKHILRENDAIGEGMVIGIHYSCDPNYPQYTMIEFLINPTVSLVDSATHCNINPIPKAKSQCDGWHYLDLQFP